MTGSFVFWFSYYKYLPIINSLNAAVNTPAQTSAQISLIFKHSIIISIIVNAAQHLNVLLLQHRLLMYTMDGLFCMLLTPFFIILRIVIPVVSRTTQGYREYIDV